ncbi:hypothetical protein G7Y79_00020g048910 [Physcia stellaris]|nr:hypothetical protein G7Y79_00020g048910 [Physcia stellaris]
MTSSQSSASSTVAETSHPDGSTELVVWHDTFEAGHDAFITYAGNHGYNIKIRRSENHSVMRDGSMIKERFRVTLECDEGCPWETTCYKGARATQWKFTTKAKPHNHPSASAKDFRVHHKHQMTDEVRKEIAIASEKGMTSAEILDDLATNHPNHPFTAQDIYNAKKKIKTQKLGTGTSMEALHDALALDPINWFWGRRDVKHHDRVDRLFLVNRYAADLLSKNSEILVLDSTCKVRQYGLSMLAFLGQTSLGTSFYWGLAFVNTENRADLTWVMFGIDQLYRRLGLQSPLVVVFTPNWVLFEVLESRYPAANILLSIYHMNKEIRKHCKHSFNDGKAGQEWQEFMKHWSEVVHAFTREGYNLAWRDLKSKYKRSHRDEVLYLHKTWLGASWRRCFCNYNTNDILHFNAHRSPRVEGGHRILKQMLRCSTGNMELVVKRLEALFLKQYEDYSEAVEQIRTEPAATKFNRQLYRDLLTLVTPHALHRTEKQYRRFTKAKKKPDTHPLEPCTGTHSITTGTPCAHNIRDFLELFERDRPGDAPLLPLQLLHPHLRLLKPKSSFITPEPGIIASWDSLVTHVDSDSDSDSVTPDREKRFLDVEYVLWDSRNRSLRNRSQPRSASLVPPIDDEGDALNSDRALENSDVVDADRNDDPVVNDGGASDVDDDDEGSIADHSNGDVSSDSVRVLDNGGALNSAHDENNASSSGHADGTDNVMDVGHISDVDDADVIEVTNKEPAITELEDRHREPQSKDGTTTRTKRRRSKSIDRNPSGHESELPGMTTRSKKAKLAEIKTTRKKIVKMTQPAEAQNTLGRDRGRGGRGRGGRGRGGRGRDVTRSKVVAEKPMEVLNDSSDSSDSAFEDENGFGHLSSDDDYENASDEGYDPELNIK